jgi:hypothetical protein
VFFVEPLLVVVQVEIVNPSRNRVQIELLLGIEKSLLLSHSSTVLAASQCVSSTVFVSSITKSKPNTNVLFHFRLNKLANCSNNNEVVKIKTFAIAENESKEELLEIRMSFIQNMVLRDPYTDDIESIMDKGDDENDLLLSPSSPRLTISSEPLGPLSLTLSQKQRQSQLQQNDKPFPFHNSYDLSLERLARVPSLSLIACDPAVFGCSERIEAANRCNQNKCTVRDLSQLPIPTRIRLLPRRRKVVTPRNHWN